MVVPKRPDGSVDSELKIALLTYGHGGDDREITPKPGTGYGSRAWLLEHLNAGRRHYKEPYFDDDPKNGFPQSECSVCHVAIVNFGEHMCSDCVEKFKMCKRCRRNPLYLDWDHYHLDMCKKCLVLEHGACERCERPAQKDATRCHAHAKGNEVEVPRSRFWSADFSMLEECPVRPKIIC